MKNELFRLAGEYLRDAQAREDRQMLMLKFLKGVFIFLAIGMAFVAGRVTAAPLAQPTPVQELFVDAIKLGGFEEFCTKREQGCPMPRVVITQLEPHIGGQFTWYEPTMIKVTINEAPGSLEWNETLVHEFVHFLQWLKGDIGPSSSCEQVRDAEVVAYKAGDDYLARFEIVKDRSFAAFMLMTMCVYG